MNDKIRPLNSILLADVPEINAIEYLADGLFLKTGLIAVVGASDVGKSSFIRQLIISVGNQSKEFLEHRLNVTTGNVIYVSSEDNESIVKYLMQMQTKKLGASLEFLNRVRIISQTEDLPANLKHHFEQDKFDVVVIDTYADVFIGDINKSTDARFFLNPFQKIADQNNCLVIFLHHIGKGKQNSGPGKDNIVGSQGFESKMRTVFELSEAKGEKSKRILQITKGNYFSPEQKENGLTLKFDDRCFFLEGVVSKIHEPNKEEISKEKEVKIIEMLKEKKSFTDIQNALKVSPSRISAIKKQLGLL